MAVTQNRVTVTNAATKIAENTSSSGGGEGDYRDWRFLIKNSTGTASVFLGDSTVTTANGVEWAPADGALSDLELEPGEALYGIVVSTSQTVHVLKVGR